MADVARLQLEVDSRKVVQATDAVDDLALAGQKAEAASKRLTSANIPLEATNAKLAVTTDKLAKETNEEAVAKLKSQKATLDSNKANQQAAGISAKLAQQQAENAKISLQNAGATTKLSGGVRNLSLQLNQVAQQGAVTGNFLQALSIQLPDILLSFGTLGVLVGAAAGAFAGPLLSALQGTNEELEKLDDNINDLNDDFSTLTEAQRRYLVTASDKKQKDINNNISELSESIIDAEQNLRRLEDGFRRTARGQRIAVATDPEAITKARDALEKLNAARSTANQKLEREKQLQKDIIAGRSEAAEKERDSIQARLRSLEGGFDPAERALQQFGARNEIIRQAEEAKIQTVTSFDELRKQNAERLQEDLNRIEQQGTDQRTKILTDGQQAGLAITSSLLGQAASIAREGGKEQFDQYKALASAQAAVSASLAIANALASVPAPFNIALAGTIGALAAVQISQIQQQEYQPRVLGGQMKAGGSFLVGERGPELITMGNRNANITPNNQLNGEPAGPQVTQVFNISAGVQGTVQAEIARSIPLIKQVAISSINENIKAGGSVARQVGRRR